MIGITARSLVIHQVIITVITHTVLTCYKLRERERETREKRWERRGGFNPSLTGLTDPDPRLWPASSPISGHRSGQAWYRFEAWETSYVFMPLLSPENDRKVTDRGLEVPRNRRLDLTWFRRFPVKPSLGFCSLPYALPFPTNHGRRRRRFTVDRPLMDSRLWELDPEPSPRVGGHHRHHWTQRGLNFQFWASRRRRLNSGDRWPTRVFW